MFQIPADLPVLSAGRYRVVTPQQAMKGYVVLIGNHGSWVDVDLKTESRQFKFIGKTENGNYIVEDKS